MLRAFWEAGYKIPGDYTVVGFDNINIDDYMTIKLTSVAVGLKATAERAVDTLMERIKNNNNAQQIFFTDIYNKKRQHANCQKLRAATW